MKRKLILAGKILAGIAVLGVLALAVFVLVVLPRLSESGEDAAPFFYDKDMAISKTAADGTPYTVNNSLASFRLDVAKPDRHCSPVFPSYADAVRYCQSNGLPALPSVQVIQGRLKVLDDQFCIALERAVRQQQRHALESLLRRLVANRAPDEAVVHVGAALSLEGFEPEGLDSGTRQRMDASLSEFRAAPDAQPIGFWDTHDDLARAFQSDRYLMRGLPLHESAEACVAISRAIAEDAALTDSFLTLRTFGAKLTNPAEALPPEAITQLTPDEVRQRFPSDARFALVSYSASHEAALLERLNRERPIPAHANLMPFIIDAVRSGRLSLDPAPGSGWYDYQWHALETLLVPERGHESAKLKLSAAYRKRLENAFSSALAKNRETHIKRLPVITLGGSIGSDTPPQKITVAPDFSAEPTLTAYLRLGRGYRFLRQAMSAIFQDEWQGILLGPGQPLDEALDEAALFCYGLYETLCLETGLKPRYLPDELDTLDRGQAVAVFTRWRESWQDDPALANDTRMAAPVAQWNAGGPVRHWGTAGVRLEAAVYAYHDKPMVGGNVEPEFVPCTVYLPTDIFIEFSSPAPVTRTAFRSRCDTCPDSAALLKTFGYTPPASTETGLSILLGGVKKYWGWAVAIGVCAVFWRVRRTRKWIALSAVALIIAWGCCFAFSPYYRTSFLVRRIAPINVPLAMMCQGRICCHTEAPALPVLKALADLYVHPDPQIRYLATCFSAIKLEYAGDFHKHSGSDRLYLGIKDSLMRAANDPDPEIAAYAVHALRHYRTPDVADLLLAKLPDAKGHDTLCYAIINSLGYVGDPRAIETIRPFCDDPQQTLRYTAIAALSRFPQPEAQACLWQLAESPDLAARHRVIHQIKANCVTGRAPQMSEADALAQFDGLAMARVNRTTHPFDVRRSFVFFMGDSSAVQASAILLEAADSHAQSNAVLSALTHRYTPYHQDAYTLSNFLDQASVQQELARSVSTRDPAAVTQALVNVISNVTTNDPPDIQRLADDILRKSGTRRR